METVLQESEAHFAQISGTNEEQYASLGMKI